MKIKLGRYKTQFGRVGVFAGVVATILIGFMSATPRGMLSRRRKTE